MAEMNVSILVRLLDQVSGPARRVRESVTLATKALEVAGKRSDELFKSAGNLRQAAEGVSAFSRGIGSLVVGPLKLAADYDEVMRRVGARAKASSEEMSQLNASAMSIGSSSEFTPQMVASSMLALSESGLRASAVMSTLPNVLELAKGKGVELSEATAATTAVMKGFSLGASDSARVVDVLVATTNISAASLGSLSQAMTVAAPAASALGVSIETTAAMVGMLSNAGVEGSQAGSAVATMLRSLLKPSALAKSALSAIGVSLTDKDTKQLKSIDVVLGEIADKTKGLDAGKTGRVATAIFGGSAPAVLELLSKGRDGIANVTTELNKSAGAAARLAVQVDGDAKGATEGFESAITSLKITVGQSLLPSLTVLAESMTTVIGKVGEWTREHPVLTATVMGSLGGLFTFSKTLEALMFTITTLKSVGGFLSLGQGIAQFAKIILGAGIPAVLSFSTALLANPIFLVTAAIAALTLGVVAIVRNLDWFSGAWDRFNKASTTTKTTLTVIGAVLGSLLSPIAIPIGALVLGAKAIMDNWEPIKSWFSSVWDSIASAIGGGVSKALNFLSPLLSNPIIQWLMSAGQGIGNVVGEIANIFGGGAPAIESPTDALPQVENLTDMRSRMASERGLSPRVEGTLRIEVGGNTPARVTSVRSSGGLNFDVRNGVSMVSP